MALNKSKRLLTGILATVIALTSMPVIARDWIQTSNNAVVDQAETEYYYHLSNGFHITWTGSKGENWSNGAPFSQQSTTVTLKQKDIDNLITNLPALQGKTIKDITYKRYTNKYDDSIPAWKQPLFGFWPTAKNTGKDDYFGEYGQYFAQNIIPTSNYNPTTGEFTYSLNYSLYTATNKHGIELHTKYWRAYEKSIEQGKTEKEAHALAVEACENELTAFFGPSKPKIDWDIVGKSKDFRVVIYVLPGVFRFEVEKEEPGVSITAPAKTDVACAGLGIEGSKIQLVVNRPRKEWLKTTGKIIFTDATGKNTEFKIEKDVSPEQFKNDFLSVAWCIPFDVEELLATYIPDPSKPEETYEEKFILEKNDMGITDIKLVHNNKNVSAPTVGKEHTIKVDVSNLGDKVVKEPTIDITVTEKDKTVLVQETVNTEDDLKEKGKVTILLDNVKPNSNEITVCAVINQDKHTANGDNIANENDKLCKRFKD